MADKPIQTQVDAPFVFKCGMSYVANDQVRTASFVFAASDVDDARNKALKKAAELGWLYPRVTSAARY